MMVYNQFNCKFIHKNNIKKLFFYYNANPIIQYGSFLAIKKEEISNRYVY